MVWALLVRTLGVVGVLILAAGACALWNVYGAWPVPDGYEFPRHSMWGGGPVALFEGQLEVVDGCIRTVGVEPTTVVWPPGYSLSLQDGQPIVHGIGHDARMEESIRLGGGYYTRDQLRAVAAGAAETRCPGPFFLTTGLGD